MIRIEDIQIGEMPVNDTSLLEAGVKPPLPSIIDSTMMVAYRDCPAQFHRSHVLKRAQGQTSVPLIAGGAFASGIEAYRRAWYADGLTKRDSLDIAFLAAISSWGEFDPFPQGKHEARSLDRVLSALASYFTLYDVETDIFQPHIRVDTGEPTIEFGAAIPLDPSYGFPLHPSTGEPFIWHLRSDALGRYNRTPVFSDEKTTESLGASWSSKWLLRNQFLGYAWCYREMGLPYRTALVRGVGILKTKTTHAETIITYPEHVLDMWQNNAVYDLHQMVQMWEANYWPERIGNACTSFGNCQFTDVCLAHPQNKVNFLKTGYHHRVWDPSSTHNRRSPLEEALHNGEEHVLSRR